MRIALLVAAAVLLSCAARRVPEAASGQAGAPAQEPKADVVTRELDLDHDGKPDTWRTTRRLPDGREVLVRVERDLNGDGRVDLREFYDAEGNLERQELDLDFDGKPDVILHFEKGQLASKEYAFGFDGKPHAWSYYEKGRLVRKERDENGDGRVDYWEYWENGEIDRVGIDLDGDGKVDRWESRKGSAEPAASSPQK